MTHSTRRAAYWFSTTLLIGLVLCSCQSSESTAKEKRLRLSPRLSEDQIRSVVLEKTPLGTTVEEVLSFVSSKLLHVNQGMVRYDEWNRNIQVLLGKYGLGRETYITWEFDENRKLINVFVKKYRDFL